MLKLNAGFSRKVGEPNYGSRGASVNVELELEGHLVSDTDALTERIRKLFQLARHSVDAELAAPGSPATPAANAQQNSNPQRQARLATASQLRAIRAICQQQDLDPAQQAHQQCGVNDPQELTLREASNLIDHLKSQNAHNGVRR